jgi:hypothetical protein
MHGQSHIKEKICRVSGKGGDPSCVDVVLKYSETKIWSKIYIGKEVRFWQ